MRDWNAEEYARSSSAQLGWARELIDKLGLRGDESVLDIGCGDGKVTAEIARRVPRGSVLGVDSSPDMIRRARGAWPAALHRGLGLLFQMGGRGNDAGIFRAAADMITSPAWSPFFEGWHRRVRGLAGGSGAQGPARRAPAEDDDAGRG